MTAITLIDFWNTLSHVRRHKNKNTKVYTSAKKHLFQLKRGTLMQNWFDPCWINQEGKKKRIKLINNKWTDKQIINAMIETNKYFIPGYWPRDKTRLPKELYRIIYNDISGKSLLAQAALSPPTQLTRLYNKLHLNSKEMTVHKYLFRTVDEINKHLDEADKLIIQKAAKEIIEVYDTFDFENSDGDYEYWIGSPKKLVTEYIRFVTKAMVYRGFCTISPYSLLTSGFFWIRFVDNFEDTTDIDFYTGKYK